MNLEFPYQLVAFLDKEPEIGESVYSGDNGWYPQIALKRRFKTNAMSEQELLEKLTSYCANTDSFVIHTGELGRPDRMPVKILPVESSPELTALHRNFIAFVGDAILSRYPDREGQNYLPHVTAEFNGQMVINDQEFSQRDFTIDKVYLLKDIVDENSVAYSVFDLR